MMEKVIIHIGLEFLFGPIQKLHVNQNGEEITGVLVIDNDSTTQSLDNMTNTICF